MKAIAQNFEMDKSKTQLAGSQVSAARPKVVSRSGDTR